MRRIAHTSRSIALMAGLVMFGGLVVAPAMAGTVTYSFSGVVGNVGSALFRPANPAPFNTVALSAVSGTMTVDTTDHDSGNLIRGQYNIQSMDVMIGNYHMVVGPSGTVVIRNGNGSALDADRFLVRGVDASGNPSVRSFAPRLFTIDLTGPNGAYPSGNLDHLPNPAPSINSFSTDHKFRLQFGPGNQDRRAVTGDITALTAVPLPPAVILFGVGLVALIGLGAGGLRNLRLPQA